MPPAAVVLGPGDTSRPCDGVRVDPGARRRLQPCSRQHARTIATLPSSAMRRHASHWAFRPTSRSSQKLCSRSATSRERLVELLGRDELAAVGEQRSFLEAEGVDRPERTRQEYSALRRPSSSSTRSAMAGYSSAKLVRSRRASSRTAASSSLVLGVGTPSRLAGGRAAQVAPEFAGKHIAKRDGAQLGERLRLRQARARGATGSASSARASPPSHRSRRRAHHSRATRQEARRSRRCRGRSILRIDGGSAEDVSDAARARSS